MPRYFDDDFELAALRCFRCGGTGHREFECSQPAKIKPCHLCGYSNHMAGATGDREEDRTRASRG